MDRSAASAQTSRKSERLVRALGNSLRRDDLEAFATLLDSATDPRLFDIARSQKILVRGEPATRERAADLMSSLARVLLDPADAAEFERYAKMSLLISLMLTEIKSEIGRKKSVLSRLSLPQLLEVADFTFQRFYQERASRALLSESEQSVSENERRLHKRAGDANDILFAITRALNEIFVSGQGAALRRADAIIRARELFYEVTHLAGQLNSLEHILDCASFGEFRVTHFDDGAASVRLDIVDVRLRLLRELSLRRRLTHYVSGKLARRLLRDNLRESVESVLAYALDLRLSIYEIEVPEKSQREELRRQGSQLLSSIGAEDDFIYISHLDSSKPAFFYYFAFAMRLHALAAEFIQRRLTRKAQRSFDSGIYLDDVIAMIATPKPTLEDAQSTWDALTLDLPARSHFDIIRHPFVRDGKGRALPVTSAAFGAWAPVVREILNQGGQVGARYGEIWEMFVHRAFEDTGWDIIGSNINLRNEAGILTEIDLLLLRGDLLLVCEIKGLTGSGVSAFDHWKNRMIIERGCRQARLSANYLTAYPDTLVSLAGRKRASAIRYIQPVVLTNENMFDGWEHANVPVAGTTIRSAITEGSRAEYYDARSHEVLHVDHHLRPEDISTETILAALRNPIEMTIAPEKGEVEHLRLDIGEVTFFVPVMVCS